MNVGEAERTRDMSALEMVCAGAADVSASISVTYTAVHEPLKMKKNQQNRAWGGVLPERG